MSRDTDHCGFHRQETSERGDQKIDADPARVSRNAGIALQPVTPDPDASYVAIARQYIAEHFEPSQTATVSLSWLKCVIEYHLEDVELGGPGRGRVYVTQTGTLAAFVAEGYRTRTSRAGTIQVFVKKRRPPTALGPVRAPGP